MNSYSPTIEQVNGNVSGGDSSSMPILPDNLVTTDDLSIEINPIKNQLIWIKNDLATQSTRTWVLERI